MKIRRLIAAALAAGTLAIPSSGHALASKSTTIAGSDCTVGESTLTYNKASFVFEATSKVTCAAATDVIQLTFSVFRVSTVNTHPAIAPAGPSAFTSWDAAATPPSTQFGCGNCPTLLARGVGRTLPAGLYALKSSANVVSSNEFGQTTLRGEHTDCYFITADRSEPVQKIEGCSI